MFIENVSKNDFVITKDNILYVGPFYFTDYKDGEHIVNFESESIKRATDCVFVLSNESAPGTVTEIVQSVLLNKDIHIYYVEKIFLLRKLIRGSKAICGIQ